MGLLNLILMVRKAIWRVNRVESEFYCFFVPFACISHQWPNASLHFMSHYGDRQCFSESTSQHLYLRHRDVKKQPDQSWHAAGSMHQIDFYSLQQCNSSSIPSNFVTVHCVLYGEAFSNLVLEPLQRVLRDCQVSSFSMAIFTLGTRSEKFVHSRRDHSN